MVRSREAVFAAIDVGTNAVRLKLARPRINGSLEVLHQERDPVRPGEHLFASGAISRPVADRLLSTLRRYSALCRRYHARVRAVATSAVREAHNREQIVRRARVEAGLTLEVISGKEEARLICLGVLADSPSTRRSLCIDIGGGSTELALAIGEHPDQLWSLSLGSVRLAELFSATREVTPKQLRLMREFVDEAVEDKLPEKLPAAALHALGSSGSIQSVVTFAAQKEAICASRQELHRAVEDLVAMGRAGRRECFDPRRADIVVAGAVILESVARRLHLKSVTAVDRGLRDGVLIELMRRRAPTLGDESLADAALALARRFYFDEAHATQVARLSLQLYDQLAALHQLPAATRPYLEVAALLHDIGNSLNYQRHHKHSYYLIQNADLPGLSDRERELVGRIARYHRRSPPDPSHEGMAGLSANEVRIVRRLATLLRIADSLDRSHHQPVRNIRTILGSNTVRLRMTAKAPIDLEIWDAEHETINFRHVFRRRLQLEPA